MTIFLSFLSFGQEKEDSFKLTDGTIGSGLSPLSSGIFSSFTVKNENEKLIFEVSSSYMQTMYGLYSDKLFLSVSGGYSNNTPWFGPMIVYSPVEEITLCTWEGASIGKDGEPNVRNFQFYFAYNSVSIFYSIFFVRYALLHFQNEIPNNLLGVGLTIPFSGYKLSIGGDYSLRDKKPLFAGSLFLPL